MDEGGPIDFGKFGFGIFDFVGNSGTADRFEVTITAVAFNRENTIISYSLPNIMDDGVYLLLQYFNPARPHQYGKWSAWAYADFQDRSTEFLGSHLDSGSVSRNFS